ncbi:MAG: 5-oxoprolinase subunit B family protein [Paracoccaceae bacterium]
MERTTTDPVFRPVGDHALLVDFADAYSVAAHEAVLQMDRALAAHPFPGFLESVPAYVGLLIDFDPVQTDHDAVIAHLRDLAQGDNAQTIPARREVLICYDPAISPDLPSVATRLGMSVDAVIAAHLAGDYRVAMYGFAPGYAYLSGVPDALRLDRKPAPVPGVAAGSVIIAGGQCLVTTLTMPTGWWVIGRSPTRILTGQALHPFLFDVGDLVSFRRITRAEFDATVPR